MGRWQNLLRSLMVAAIVGIGTSSGTAATIPYGVQNDVPYSTVVNDWGWTVAYRDDYGATVSLADVLQNVTGDYLMLAAIQDGSDTFELLAAALKADVLLYTSLHVTRVLNGAGWYYNAFSMGFAGLGDAIYQNSADINGQSERDRLSWHAARDDGSGGYYQTPYLSPDSLLGGWRAGTYLGLNVSTGWDRVVLTDAAPAVPEPASLVILAFGSIGVIGVGAVGRRRRKQVA